MGSEKCTSTLWRRPGCWHHFKPEPLPVYKIMTLLALGFLVGFVCNRRFIPRYSIIRGKLEAMPMPYPLRQNNLDFAALRSTESPGAQHNQSPGACQEPLQLALQQALLPSTTAAIKDEAMLERGIVSGGRGSRSRRLLRKLAAGQNVSVVVLGGSIAMGHATSGWPQRNDMAFGAVTAQWMAVAFPMAHVTIHNGAVGATPSGYMSLCLSWHCPQDADFVMVEYAVNDPVTHDLVARRPFERLLRKLLSLPKRAEILLVMTYHNTQPFEKASAEDDMAIFAQYYGLPWVSLRDLLFHATRGAPPKLALKDIFEDAHHLLDIGHQMLADMVIGHFRRVAAGLLLLSQNESVDSTVAAEDLPAPLMQDNEVTASEHCLFKSDFRAIVTYADGFHWMNEAPDGQPPKEGFVATRPGSTLQLQLNTSDLVHGVEVPKGVALHATVALNYLGSYEHMGAAEVTCGSDCSCGASIFEGHITEHHSQHFMHRFAVSQSEHCEIHIRVANTTQSGEYKVKVVGVILMDDSAQEGRLASSGYDGMSMGVKGRTGDLRFRDLRSLKQGPL